MFDSMVCLVSLFVCEMFQERLTERHYCQTTGIIIYRLDQIKLSSDNTYPCHESGLSLGPGRHISADQSPVLPVSGRLLVCDHICLNIII